MSDPNEGQPETPVEPTEPAPGQPPQPEPPPENTNPGPLPPVVKPDIPDTTSGPNLGGAHDLEGHPALAGGTIRNVGDTVIGRDPNAPSFRRPPLEMPGEQKEGERQTTTSNPAKKSSRGKSKGEGAGPES